MELLARDVLALVLVDAEDVAGAEMIVLADVAVFVRQIALVLATQLDKGLAKLLVLKLAILDAKRDAKGVAKVALVAQVVLVVLGLVKGIVLAGCRHRQYKLINWKGRKTYEYYFY